MKFVKLLQPGYIGKVRTRNRILKTGSHPGFWEYTDGYVNPKAVDYYGALARGGVGLVVMGSGEIDYPIGTIPNMGYRIDDDKYINSLSKVAEAIHRYNCPAFIQVFHMGPMHPSATSGQQPVAASSLSKSELPRPEFDVPRELTIPEIKSIVMKFTNAVVRAHKAGFEGLELNAACNHLLNSFLSRAWNKRRDIYGYQSMENRCRIVTEIISEIKSRLGQDFPIIALINGAEPGLKDGITSEESQAIAQVLEKAGADAIHVRVEFYRDLEKMGYRDSTHFPDVALYPEVPSFAKSVVDISKHGEGGWVPLAAAVKKVVRIPVIAVGRLSPELGEKILRQNKADFISMNRRLMADHDLPNKIIEGRLKDIAPCTACFTCFDNNEKGRPPVCRVNAALGKEKEYEIVPADKKKRVLVVGGGPAGLEFSRVAALRGHEVVLYEKANKLGGAMLLAAVVKGFERENLTELINYLSYQVKKLGVKVHLGVTVNRDIIRKISPDVIVIASGGLHVTPDIPGIESKSVISGERLHLMLKRYLRYFSPQFLHFISRFWLPLGKNIVVIGSDVHGCQVAEFLVKRGRKVTIIDKENEIGKNLLDALIKPLLLNWLYSRGVQIYSGVSYKAINDDRVVFIDSKGKEQSIKADNILIALPLVPNNILVNEFKDTAQEIYVIGDANEPHLIIDAIADGFKIARQI